MDCECKPYRTKANTTDKAFTLKYTNGTGVSIIECLLHILVHAANLSDNKSACAVKNIIQSKPFLVMRFIVVQRLILSIGTSIWICI
jgi:hypothetical protein